MNRKYMNLIRFFNDRCDAYKVARRSYPNLDKSAICLAYYTAREGLVTRISLEHK